MADFCGKARQPRNAATLSRHRQQDVAQLVRDAVSRNLVFGALPVAKDEPKASGKRETKNFTGKEKIASSRHLPAPQPAPQAIMPVYQQQPQAAAASSRRPLVIIRPKAKETKETKDAKGTLEHVSAKSIPAPK